MKKITTLQMRIGTYRKTKDIFATYRKSKYSKKYLAEHEQAITAHRAAKKYFNELNLERLPTIKSLQTEYATLAAKKSCMRNIALHENSCRTFLRRDITQNSF